LEGPRKSDEIQIEWDTPREIQIEWDTPDEIQIEWDTLGEIQIYWDTFVSGVLLSRSSIRGQ
jgi:hypothetical protein